MKNWQIILPGQRDEPSVLFLSYGMNDVGAQNGEADGFIKAYRPVIRDLKNHCRIRKYMLTVYFRQRRLQLIRILSMQNSGVQSEIKKLCEKEK